MSRDVVESVREHLAEPEEWGGSDCFGHVTAQALLDEIDRLREAAIRVVDKRTLTFDGDMFLVSRREMRYLENALGVPFRSLLPADFIENRNRPSSLSAVPGTETEPERNR